MDDLKFFHYISKGKVDMLVAQMGRSFLSSFSIAPKVEFAGLSVGAEMKGEAPGKASVADALKVIKYLKKHDALETFEESRDLDTGRFYRSEREWHHGVFYFATMVDVAATYLLWTTRDHSLTLLAGSPANIIGQNTPTQGVTLSSTGDALSTLGSRSFLEEIRQEEETFSSGSQVKAALPFGRQPFSHIDWIYTIHTGSRAAPLAMFCFQYLSGLPLTRIETVFKVFSVFPSVTGNCLEDLQAEREADLKELDRDEADKPVWQRGPQHRKYVEETWERALRDATRFGLHNYTHVYLGSPVYTALI